MELPQELQGVIDNELSTISVKRLAAIASALSERYRTRSGKPGESFLRSPADVTAYAAFRLPATYAAVYSALSQVQELHPHWYPYTMLDVGAGPGTAMWATGTLWPNLKQITLLERENVMITLGRRLADASPIPAIQNASWHKTDIAAEFDMPSHDLVVASYALGELPQSKVEPVVQKLWEITRGVLVIIEPGTPIGFKQIQQNRSHLLDLGATVCAPCPHAKSCPIVEPDWCHFSQRVTRSRMHRQVKSGELPYEDEKFSFIAMSRMSGTSIQGRVIRHPQVRKGHIVLEVCTPQGLTSMVVTRKERELYRKVRDTGWGSVLPSSSNHTVEQEQ